MIRLINHINVDVFMETEILPAKHSFVPMGWCTCSDPTDRRHSRSFNLTGPKCTAHNTLKKLSELTVS